MTIDQLLIILNWLLAFGLPLLVALITKTEATSASKALTNLAATVVGTALLSVIASLAGGKPIDWFTILFTLVTSFAVSAGSYAHIWKPTGIAPAVAQYGVTGKHEVTPAA